MKRGSRPGIRPHTWISGPDQHRHQLYVDCQRSRAQAKFRNEVWEITEQEYIDLWTRDGAYLSKGRGSDDLTMTRLDKDKPWSIDNVVILTRAEHLRQCLVGKSLGRPRKYA